VSAERVRLFVALELPGEVREALLGWGAKTLRGLAGLRAVAPENLHVTLCFLGWRSDAEVAEIVHACSVAVGPFASCSLRIAGGLWLPPRRPRVLAVELEDLDGELATVQAALSRQLAAGGWYVPESRPFLAHVTVARVARGARIRASELPPPRRLEFAGSRVTLYRSRLGAGGARYEPLGTVTLGSSS
jgi:2'-5' RNA ligase